MADTKPPPVLPEDFEPFSTCTLRLTKEQLKAIKNMAAYRACLMRQQGKWSLEEEAAFINGVLTVYFACKNNLDIPASWILSTQPLLDTLANWKARGELKDGLS